MSQLDLPPPLGALPDILDESNDVGAGLSSGSSHEPGRALDQVDMPAPISDAHNTLAARYGQRSPELLQFARSQR